MKVFVDAQKKHHRGGNMKYKNNIRSEWKYQTESPFTEEKTAYTDGMDFERIVDSNLDEEDDMDALDAGFMRGYLEENPYSVS